MSWSVPSNGVGTFYESQTDTAGAAGTGMSVSLPTGRATGDICFIIVAIGGDSPTSTIGDAPSGWSIRGTPQFWDYGAGGIYQAILVRVLTGSDTNPVVIGKNANAAWETGNSGGTWAAAICFRSTDGVHASVYDSDLTSTVEIYQTTATTRQPAGEGSGQVGVDYAGSLVVQFASSSDTNALGLNSGNEQGFTLSALSGANYDSTLGSDGALAVAYKEISTAGTVTLPTFEQFDVGADYWAFQTVAVRANVAVVHSRTVTVTGQGTISAARKVEAIRTAALNAQATITASGAAVQVVERAATMDAEANITAVREFFSVLERTAALGAEATITAAAEFYSILERTSTLDAEATITAVGEVSGGAVQRAATMDAEATIVAVGERHSKYQVRNLVATAVSTTQINLSWDDVTALTGEVYDIERDGSVVVYDYAGTHSPGSPYQDQGLDPDQEYTYRVAAVGGTPV